MGAYPVEAIVCSLRSIELREEVEFLHLGEGKTVPVNKREYLCLAGAVSFYALLRLKTSSLSIHISFVILEVSGPGKLFLSCVFCWRLFGHVIVEMICTLAKLSGDFLGVIVKGMNIVVRACIVVFARRRDTRATYRLLFATCLLFLEAAPSEEDEEDRAGVFCSWRGFECLSLLFCHSFVKDSCGTR